MNTAKTGFTEKAPCQDSGWKDKTFMKATLKVTWYIAGY